jgi:hypothetical protein
MDKLTDFPDRTIDPVGLVAERFLSLGIRRFHDACRYAQQLPYGYNSDRDDLMILFQEGFGSCTTKHAVIATLAEELDLPIDKRIGIYAMAESIVSGSLPILEKYDLPYVPMVHCFLAEGDICVDLTEGNHNGKNRPIDDFLYTEVVPANISARDEYLRYRRALADLITTRSELRGVPLKRILQAREEGLLLLRRNIEMPRADKRPNPL